MYKVIIQTIDSINIPKTHLQNKISFKNHQNQAQKQKQFQQTTLLTNVLSAQIQQLTGTLHLLRNLNVAANQITSKLKSCAVLVLNSGADTEHFIRQRQMQIQCISFIKNKIKFTVDNTKQKQQPQQLVTIFPIIIFKSIAIAEQFYNFINFTNQSNHQANVFCSLAFYIQNVVVIQVDSVIPMQNWLQLLKDQISGKQIWVQIPHCFQCLSILETQVIGMHLPKRNKQSLRKLSQQRKNFIKQSEKIVCKVCWIRSKQQSHCHQCLQMQDNWVCMICGTIGCGRYKNADAFKHYANYKHILSLDLQTDRIWNYKFDCFSHRIPQVVGENIMSQENNNIEQRQKLDNQQIQMQFWKYCSVVSGQLEHQRNFYNKIKNQQIQRYNSQQKALQERIQKIKEEKEQKKDQLKKKQKKIKKMSKKVSQLQQSCDQQRQLNRQLEETIKNFNEKSENEGIRKKKQELMKIQEQIEQILMTLSGN